MRRRVTLPLVAAMSVLVFAACGGGAENTPGGTSSPADQLQVGVLTATPINQGTWDPAHHAAYTALAKRNGWDVTIAEQVPYGEAAQALNRFGDQKSDVVFVTDQGFEKAMLDAAAKYPDTKFILMSNLSTTNGLPNVASYFIDWHEAGCLAGAAAALISKTHVIGAISGQPIPAATQAFGGARFCADEAVSGSEIKIQYVNDWIDTGKAREVADALAGQKADVFFGLLAGMVPGVTGAAKDHNGYYIGWLVDESKFGPEVTATNMTVNFTQLYEQAATAIHGTFDAKIHQGTIQDGTITVQPYRLPEFADKNSALQGLYDRIKSGQLKVPDVEAEA